MRQRLPFPILYEDNDLIVIDKPAGMLTTHTRAKETNTAEEWLNDYVRKGQMKSRKHVWLVHRLDRETSGVMMFAKTERVAEAFRANWNELTEKTYVARVEGVLEEEKGVFESWLREDDDGYKVRSVSAPSSVFRQKSKGLRQPKLARTEWRRLSTCDGTTLVEVSLKSGRKNQIRVHFSEAGHPVVGDVKYGGQKASRLYLDSLRLRFRHPHTGEWMAVDHLSPLTPNPSSMNAVFFDLDGTLFDTKADLAATVNHTRRDLGLVEWSEENVIAHVGQGAKYLLTNSIPECPYEEVWEIFKSHYAEHCVERVQPYPGVVRTLGELRDRGWLLGVNTNKPNFAVKLILEKFGFTRYFGSAVVAGGDGIPLKPDAQSIRECASRLRGHRLSSHDWMVGDSWTDMQCATNAGVKGAFCTFGFGRLKEARFTVKINRFDELLMHLKAEEQF